MFDLVMAQSSQSIGPPPNAGRFSQQRRNTRIAKTRARVEHVFGALEQMGKLLCTIGQTRANFAMTIMATCYRLKRLVYFQKAGIEAFCGPKWAESPEPVAI